MTLAHKIHFLWDQLLPYWFLQRQPKHWPNSTFSVLSLDFVAQISLLRDRLLPCWFLQRRPKHWPNSAFSVPSLDFVAQISLLQVAFFSVAFSRTPKYWPNTAFPTSGGDFGRNLQLCRYKISMQDFAGPPRYWSNTAFPTPVPEFCRMWRLFRSNEFFAMCSQDTQIPGQTQHFPPPTREVSTFLGIFCPLCPYRPYRPCDRRFFWPLCARPCVRSVLQSNATQFHVQPSVQ